MVAYSFKPMFAGPIVAGDKNQTVRSRRKRHAQPGERVQLFTGLRTRFCRKILDVDPVCTSVRDILVVIVEQDVHPEIVAGIYLDGSWLDDDAIEQFAVADGFGGNEFSARFCMGQFWLAEHGCQNFTGVVINWGTGESWGA